MYLLFNCAVVVFDHLQSVPFAAEKGFALKKNLIEKQDFVLLPLAAFSVLRRTYGLAIEERDLIERTVVGSDRSPGSLHIEVYPATIRVRLKLNSLHSVVY